MVAKEPGIPRESGCFTVTPRPVATNQPGKPTLTITRTREYRVAPTVVVVLVFGGLLLRRLKRKGATLVKVGLTLKLCWLIIDLSAAVLWDAIATVGDMYQPSSEEWTPDDAYTLLLWLPLILVYFVGLVFEVVALIWLLNRDHRLPLRD